MTGGILPLVPCLVLAVSSSADDSEDRPSPQRRRC
jgi:hypothetical protein